MNPRIISGIYKNKRLKVSPVSRPITDRVKQVLFDSINDLLENSICLDLFAGSGSIGIEAISRGAKMVTFVERDLDAFKNLEENLSFVDTSLYKAINKDFYKFLENNTEKFNIIFLDPPFPDTLKLNYENLSNILLKEGIIIIRIDFIDRKKFKIPSNLDLILEKKIGRNVILFLK